MFFGSNTGLSFRKFRVQSSVSSSCWNFSRSHVDSRTFFKYKYWGDVKNSRVPFALKPTSSHRSYLLTVIVMITSFLWVTECGLWLTPFQKWILHHCQDRLIPGMTSQLHLEALGISKDGVALSYWALVGRCRVQILVVLKCHNWGCLKFLQVNVGVQLGAGYSHHPSKSLHIWHNHLFILFSVIHHVQLPENCPVTYRLLTQPVSDEGVTLLTHVWWTVSWDKVSCTA
jgi:hypothetical protein